MIKYEAQKPLRRTCFMFHCIDCIAHLYIWHSEITAASPWIWLTVFFTRSNSWRSWFQNANFIILNYLYDMNKEQLGQWDHRATETLCSLEVTELSIFPLMQPLSECRHKLQKHFDLQLLTELMFACTVKHIYTSVNQILSYFNWSILMWLIGAGFI